MIPAISPTVKPSRLRASFFVAAPCISKGEPLPLPLFSLEAAAGVVLVLVGGAGDVLGSVFEGAVVIVLGVGGAESVGAVAEVCGVDEKEEEDEDEGSVAGLPPNGTGVGRPVRVAVATGLVTVSIAP